MFVTFGMAWMCLIAIPVAKTAQRAPIKMNDDDDAPYYQHGTSGRILNGAEIYQSNGCYTCHSQLVRPTYAGTELFRSDVGGIKNDDDDTRRESSYDDYSGEKFAQIGLMRMGPDLSNFGYRADAYAAKTNLTAEQWVFEHLYNPRNNDIRIGSNDEKLEMGWSNCPSQRQMFEALPSNGQDGVFVLSARSCDGKAIHPQEEARVLTSYLLSLKRDDKLPNSLNYGPKDEDE